MEIRIAEYIPYGHENAISRPELCRRSGLRDRDVRRGIERERKNGEVIISLSGAEGYFRYGGIGDEPYYQAYMTTEKARIRSEAETLRKMHEGHKKAVLA